MAINTITRTQANITCKNIRFTRLVVQTASGLREASVITDGRFAEPTGRPVALDDERRHLASNRRVNPYRNGIVKRTLHPKSKSINMPISVVFC
jgi:hypothetical protein